jgi:hypothetical protein
MKKTIITLMLAMGLVGAAQAAEFAYPAAPYGSIVSVVGPNPELCFRGGYIYPPDRTTWRCYAMGSTNADRPRFWALPSGSGLDGFETPVQVLGADHAWIEIDGQYVPMSRSE